MRFGKQVSVIGVTALALMSANTAVPLFAKKKPAAAATSGPPAAKVYQPFSAQEKKQGSEAHPEILKEFGGAYQAAQTAYVVGVGQNIAVQSGLASTKNEFTVTLLNSSVNNAFAIPGGYVYVTRQLLGLCNSEAELAGVLGHEVGHTAARHSKKRQKRSTISGILAAAGTIGGALLSDNGGLVGALGGLAKEYSGTLTQVLIALPFSRGQEEEADDLGIQYLSKAGYDPTALSDMLTSLALQTTVDGLVAGQGEGRIPEWASTHPDPAKRVVRANVNGKLYPVSTVRKADTHFAAINGMLWDDDPAEGVINGAEFLHRDMKFKFTIPNGFGMQNSAQAVAINGTGGQALFKQAAYNGNKAAYMDAAFKEIVGKDQQVNYGQITDTTVNGIPAFYATANIAGQQGSRDLTIFAYLLGTNQTLHFVTISPAGSNPFSPMYQSMARLTDAQAAAIKARKLKIISAEKGDTASSIASKMAYGSLQLERFMALNGLRSDTVLEKGRKLKIVSY